jgi:hypothetical protein
MNNNTASEFEILGVKQVLTPTPNGENSEVVAPQQTTSEVVAPQQENSGVPPATIFENSEEPFTLILGGWRGDEFVPKMITFDEKEAFKERKSTLFNTRPRRERTKSEEAKLHDDLMDLFSHMQMWDGMQLSTSNINAIIADMRETFRDEIRDIKKKTGAIEAFTCIIYDIMMHGVLKQKHLLHAVRNTLNTTRREECMYAFIAMCICVVWARKVNKPIHFSKAMKLYYRYSIPQHDARARYLLRRSIRRFVAEILNLSSPNSVPSGEDLTFIISEMKEKLENMNLEGAEPQSLYETFKNLSGRLSDFFEEKLANLAKGVISRTFQGILDGLYAKYGVAFKSFGTAALGMIAVYALNKLQGYYAGQRTHMDSMDIVLIIITNICAFFTGRELGVAIAHFTVQFLDGPSIFDATVYGDGEDEALDMMEINPATRRLEQSVQITGLGTSYADFGVRIPPDVIPQADISPNSAIVVLLTTLLAGTPMSEIFTIKKITEMARLASHSNGIENLLDGLWEIFRSLRSVICEITGLPDFVEKTGNTALDRFFIMSDDIANLLRNGKFAINEPNLYILNECIRQGENILLSTNKKNTHKAYVRLVESKLKTLSQLRDKFAAANVYATGLRQEPTTTCLFGPAGVLKTVSATALCHAAVIMDCKNEIEYQNHMSNDYWYIFNRMVETKHWDGYRDTIKVVFVDDYGQLVVDGSDPDGESMNIIRLHNTSPMELHMAALELKGNTKARPTSIVMTTNLRKVEPTDIVCRAAIWRRLEPGAFYVTVKKKFWKDPNAGYWSEQMDPNKLKKDAENKTIVNLDMIECFKHDPRTGKTDFSKPYDFEALVEHHRQRYLKALAHYEVNQKMFFESDVKYWNSLQEMNHTAHVNDVHTRVAEYNAKFRTIEDNIIVPEEKSFMKQLWDRMRMPGAFPQMDAEVNSEFKFIDWDETPEDFTNEEIEDFISKSTLQAKKGDFYKFLGKCSDDKVEDIRRRFEHCFYFSDKGMVDYFKDCEDSILDNCDLSDEDKKEQYCWLMASWLSHIYMTDKYTYRYVTRNEGAPNTIRPVMLMSDIGSAEEWFVDKRRDLIGEEKNKIWEFLCKTSDVIQEHPFLALITVIVSAYGIYKFVGSVDTSIEPQYLHEHKVKSKPRTMERVSSEPQYLQEHRVRSVPKTMMKIEKVDPQADVDYSLPYVEPQVDDNGVAIVKTVLNRNVLNMEIDEGTGFKTVGYITMLVDNIAVCPQHYHFIFNENVESNPSFGEKPVRFLRNDLCIFRTTVKNFLSYFANGNTVVSFPDKDLVFFQFPRAMPRFRNMVDKIIPESDLVKLQNIRLCVSARHRQFHEIPVALVRGKNFKMLVGDPEDFHYYLSDIVEYDTTTGKGDCGIPVFVMDSRLGAGRIIGFHSAGSMSANKGYCSTVSREFVIEQLKKFTYIDHPDRKYMEEDFTIVPQLGNLMIQGLTVKNFKHTLANHHDIVPSPLQNHVPIPVREAPAALNCVNGVSPRNKAISKYRQCDISYDLGKNEFAYELAKDSMRRLIMSIPKPSGSNVIPLEEALWGNDEEFITSINSASSAGILHKKECPSLKKLLYKEGAPRDRTHRSFNYMLERVERILDLMRNRIRPEDYYTFNLKAERRPVKKVLECSSRAFMGAPFDFCVVGAMFYSKFRQAYVKNRIADEGSLGVNCLSMEWHSLYEASRRFSNSKDPIAGDSDYSAYDVSHWKRMQWDLFDLIEEWHDDEHKGIREIIWLDFVDPYIVIDNVVFTILMGQPSGCFVTPVMNCLINSFNWRYCFYRALIDNNLPLTLRFRDHIFLSVHGDDNYRTMVEEMWDILSFSKVKVYMSELGHTITPANKGDVELDCSKLSEILYLKRKFRYEPVLGFVVAPLAKETIEEMILWTKKGNELDIFVSNCNTALREASLWGNEYYNWFSKIIIDGINSTCPQLLEQIKIQSRIITLAEIFERGIAPGTAQNFRLVPIVEPQLGLYHSACDLASEMKEKRLIEKYCCAVKGPGLFNPHCQIGPKIVEDSSLPHNLVFSVVYYNKIAMNNKDSSSSEIGKDGTFRETQVYTDSLSVENKDITTFHNDGALREADVIAYDKPGDDLYGPSEFRNEMSIISFLERPKKLAASNFLSTDTYGNIGGAAWNASFFPKDGMNAMVLNKLQGIAGIRYDLEFELVVNATRFVQGLYWFYFTYTGGVGQSRASEWYAPHNALPITRSQLHGVKIDLSCDTRVVLKVPWVSAYDFMPLPSTSTAWDNERHKGHMGFINLAPFSANSALAPAGESASFQIYWRMTNITLIGAMAAPQMDVSIREAKSKNAGPIESVARKVSKASAILTQVPFFSPVAGSLKWASDITAGVASVFGWSRPQNDSTMMRVKRKPLAYTANVDALDNSDNIALFTTNSVDVFPGFAGTNIDELDFRQFCSRYCLAQDYAWTSGDVAGTNLGTMFVSPALGNAAHPAGVCLSPMALLREQFKYWRGSIRFKITLVKTEFHSGRLAITYNPNMENIVTPLVYSDTDYVYKDIIDIRLTSVYEFIIPYFNDKPYCADNTGSLKIWVVDELKRPSNVSNTVRVLVEVAGGDDLEFAYPKANYLTPVIDVVPQMDLSTTACGNISKTLGNMDSPINTLKPSKVAIGERVLSWRTLLKRFNGGYDSLVSGDPAANSILIRAFASMWYDTTVPAQVQNADTYSLLSSMYLLSRGSVRFKYINPVSQDLGVTVGATTKSKKFLGQAYLLGPMSASSGAGSVVTVNVLSNPQMSKNTYNQVIYFNPYEENGVEISVPQYTLTHSRPNAETRCAGRYIYPQTSTDSSIYSPIVIIRDPTLDTYNPLPADEYRFWVSRAGGEDTNFGFFVSVPPMYSTTVVG